MSEMNRRRFIKLMGQGTAAVGTGMGLAGGAWAAEGPPQGQGPEGQQQTPQVQQKVWDDLLEPDQWEVYYPGVYEEEHEKKFKELQADLDKINNRGDLNIKDLISGKLDGAPGIGGGHGRGGGTKISLENMKRSSDGYGENNPLFTDSEYGKKTKYGRMIAFPFIAMSGSWPDMPSGMGDYKVISDLNVSQTFYRPVFEGDTLFSVVDRQDCVDITPKAGSRYRTFAISGTGRTFNQKGELVAKGSRMVKESFRRHKDPARRFTGGAVAWESPEWWYLRPRHTYTDKDWEKIIAMWKAEKIRGEEPLYWDDIKIGEEPTPRAVGPIISEVQSDILMSSKLSTDQKHNVLDSKTFATMKKNKYGIYVLPEYLEKKSATGPSTTAAGGAPELAHRDGRAVVENSVCAFWAAGMLLNWMGDQGWLHRFGWDIMGVPPGYPEYVIPPFPSRPALFDKFPYLENVPYLKGKRADCHGMEGDMIISKAYVYDKYKKDNEYFVELIWWCETLDNYLIEEGFATVKLPKKA